jgi:hypothetical protein
VPCCNLLDLRSIYSHCGSKGSPCPHCNAFRFRIFGLFSRCLSGMPTSSWKLFHPLPLRPCRSWPHECSVHCSRSYFIRSAVTRRGLVPPPSASATETTVVSSAIARVNHSVSDTLKLRTATIQLLLAAFYLTRILPIIVQPKLLQWCGPDILARRVV